jgi:hypothetical protein
VAVGVRPANAGRRRINSVAGWWVKRHCAIACAAREKQEAQAQAQAQAHAQLLLDPWLADYVKMP